MTLTKEEIHQIQFELRNYSHDVPFCDGYQLATTKYLLQLKAERERAEYWSKRCLAAENCLDKSPCDPDITKDQIEAHRNWEAAKKNEYNKP